MKLLFNTPLRVIFFLFILSFSSSTNAQAVTKTLNENWQFKATSDTIWQTATVPGVVHTDLLNNGIIKDPFYRMNELDLQWIDKKDWEYRTYFKLKSCELTKQKIELEFEGLDTYSEVYVNGQQVLETDNMFRTFLIDVKQYLKKGENELLVVFDSPIKKGIEKFDETKFTIPVSGNDMAELGKVKGKKRVSVFTRKAGYHYGWDWGTRLVTSGIWKPIKLKLWNEFDLKDVFIEQKELNQKASLNAKLEIDATENKTVTIDIFVNDLNLRSTPIKLTKGFNAIVIPFTIENPELWWPNGLGNQVLYDVTISVHSENNSTEKTKRIGLRHIEVMRDKDAIGSSFYFKVNGVPVFMKGANYIPQDAFLNRVTSTHYKHILSSAKHANMNMIRVWGGGIYENDEFYDMCDEMGLLVWQDFMFACAMFPGDDNFLESVKQEAISNVKRLRNHPSIALWCGNNEVLIAWENWGWKKREIKTQGQEITDKIYKAYTDVFHNILPEVVNQLDSSRFYWASSPSSALSKKPNNENGDMHYWMVWWGKEPFNNYNKEIPRFMSEYGFQSFPTFSSVKRFTTPDDYDIYSDVMKSHQRSSIGNETVDEYMKRHYNKPKDFQNTLYISQLLQAYGVNIGAEAHRRNMHNQKCMGSLYWQINDCWPVASWSSIDYYGKWKALHYKLRESFKTTLISFEDSTETIDIHIISDSLNDFNGSLNVQLINFEDKVLKNWNKRVTIKGNDALVYLQIPKKSINQFSSKHTLLKAELIGNEKTYSEKIHYLEKFKYLELTNPTLTYSVIQKKDVFEVTISNSNHAIGVYLESDNPNNFSTNFFDMIPNSKKTVSIKKGSKMNLKKFKKNLKIYNLYSSISI